ncbi:unnamed protein product, partial [Adineta steineri]
VIINNNQFSNEPSVDSQDKNQILTLQDEIAHLEEQLKTNQISIELLTTNLQLITQENDILTNDNHNLINQLNEFRKQSIPFDTQQRHISQLSTIDHAPIEEPLLHTITPVQSANTEQEIDDIQQLQTDISLLRTQCAQLDEANRAWKDFHHHHHNYSLTFQLHPKQ